MSDNTEAQDGHPNLVKYPKGVTGNPRGRPVGSISFKREIQQAWVEQMKTRVEGDAKERPFFTVFNEKFLAAALDPESQAARFIADRIYSADILKDLDSQVNKERREDLDFMAFRVYKRAFDIQQRILISASRDIVLMAGRRAGKTSVFSLLCVKAAATVPRARVLVIGLTITRTEGLYKDEITTTLEDLGLNWQYNVTDAAITLPGEGVLIQLGGNANKAEREKYRGHHWDIIIIDEGQSQPDLKYLVEDICSPMLLDTGGQLVVGGTGPRTRGTYWEWLWANPRPSGLRLNWDLTMNPHIRNHESAIADYCAEHGVTENDPMVLRELRGQVVYDDDALVYRANELDNVFTWEEFDVWLTGQSPADIRFVAGLDFGREDSDGLIVVCYSEKRNEKFVVYEYKKNGTGFVELADKIREAMAFIAEDPKFKHAYNRKFDTYADTNEAKFITDANRHYGLAILPAYKHDKAMGIQMLQDEVKTGHLKVLKDGVVWEEMLRTVFKRVEIPGGNSMITREIDDEVYHPDALDALLYALRRYFLNHTRDHFGPSDPGKQVDSLTPTGPTEDALEHQRIIAAKAKRDFDELNR